MKIYTSCFPMIYGRNDAVSIARIHPDYFTGPQFTPLMPTHTLFSEWRRHRDRDAFTFRFNKQLGELSAATVMAQLASLAMCSRVILICWEPFGEFCHRHLVAEWLRKNGIQCNEWFGEEE